MNENKSLYLTQNDLLLRKLMEFYHKDEGKQLDRIINIINGNSKISLRLIDWFVTNYAKMNFIIYPIIKDNKSYRFKVYIDYKLKLKAYSKKRFDPFCRWDRIEVPYKDEFMVQTTIGQLNFFKWAIENEILEYIENHYIEIENDMNKRNSTAKNRDKINKTRKKREELSISASKHIKKEKVEIVVKFD